MNANEQLNWGRVTSYKRGAFGNAFDYARKVQAGPFVLREDERQDHWVLYHEGRKIGGAGLLGTYGLDRAKAWAQEYANSSDHA